jgi:hypothetical protein
MKVNVEVTDTFGHEANYSWVRRYSFDCLDLMSHYAIVRRAKREIGWSGQRCSTVDYGDTIELRPYGACQVAFITFEA